MASNRLNLMSGSTVRAARKRAGLTIAQAAALVMVSPVTWSRWEGNTSSPSYIPPFFWWGFQVLTDQHPTDKLVRPAPGTEGGE